MFNHVHVPSLILLAALVCGSAQAVEYQCAPSAVLGGRASTGTVVGDKTWPYVLSTDDGDAAYWYCKDAAGFTTYAQFHATTEAEKTAMANWLAHLAFFGPVVVKEQRTASCVEPSKLPTAQEQRLCTALNLAISLHWPK